MDSRGEVSKGLAGPDPSLRTSGLSLTSHLSVALPLSPPFFLFFFLFFVFVFVFLLFLGPLLRHMEVPRLGVQSEL